MANTYLFAGASSKMAESAASLLKQQGHSVIGLSTKETHSDYDAFYTLSAYESANFPKIEKPINGLVYFPGTILLKPLKKVVIM